VGEIDLLLLDVVLPRTSGPEVARRAVELRPGIRVLFMSGFTDDTLTRHGLRPSTTELLEKPFTPETILARVRSLLDVPATPLENTLSIETSRPFPVEHH
jgi:DNA-binding response OmpR family regulator